MLIDPEVIIFVFWLSSEKINYKTCVRWEAVFQNQLFLESLSRFGKINLKNSFIQIFNWSFLRLPYFYRNILNEKDKNRTD